MPFISFHFIYLFIFLLHFYKAIEVPNRKNYASIPSVFVVISRRKKKVKLKLKKK